MQKEKLISPRYRWFKRLQWGVAISLLLLLAVCLWWGWEAQRRLDATIAKWSAAGEPVLLGDFARPPVPDEENAAFFLNEAAKALQLPSGFRDFNEVEAVIESQPDSALALVSQLMEMNQETLRLIAAARARPAADWQLSLSAVPRDPYAADDRPIGYAPNASPPVLYCLNVDGVDDGGRFELKTGGGVDGDAADLVFFLNGDRPRRPLAASASGGQSAATQSAPASQSSSVETVPDDHEINHTERDEGR